MENLACDPSILRCLALLAGSPPDQPPPAAGLLVYGQWPLLTALVAGVGALCKLLQVVWKNEHRDVDGARLSLEQVSSAFFVAIVLQEARRVFAIVDDHIPLTLSQAKATNPSVSRFDYFCQSLRSIPADELADRGKYANIIKESFGRIIADSAERLIDAMASAGSTASNAVLNPTTARFSLEGDGFLSFAGVAQFDYENRKLETRFRRIWTAVGAFSLLGIVSGIGVLAGILVNQAWAQATAPWALLALAVFAVLALVAYGLSFLVKRSLIRRSQQFGDPSSVAEFVKQKKAANVGKGN